MLKFILILVATVAISAMCMCGSAHAEDHEDSDSPGQGRHGHVLSGGEGGDGGRGGRGGNGGRGGEGGDADASARAKSRSNSESYSRSSAYQSQGQGQGQGISAFNGNTTIVEAPDFKGAARHLSKRASEAARATAGSSGSGQTPCGDHTGLSVSTGPVGGAMGTTSEACKVFRLRILAEGGTDAFYKAARFMYWAAFPFRVALNIASFGILN